MPSLLPSRVIPDTMKTSYVIIDSYEDHEIRGVLANLNLMCDKVFNNAMELLFEVDSMLESYLSATSSGDLGDFSLDILDKCTTYLNRLQHECKDSICAFAVKICFVRNAQWKGIVECVETGESSDFKTIPELMSFMTDILERVTDRSEKRI